MIMYASLPGHIGAVHMYASLPSHIGAEHMYASLPGHIGAVSTYVRFIALSYCCCTYESQAPCS